MAWDKASKANYAALRHESKTTLARLSSTERLKFMSFGEVPRYFNSLLRVSSEQHPMVTAVKDAEKMLSAKPQDIGKQTDIRMRAEAYR
jgi:hypothetical protein